MNIVDRFIKYVKVDTQSDPKSVSTPSSSKQLVLAKILVDDMKTLGMSDAHVDEYGVVYGSIEGNIENEVDVIGFIAHMDTSPDMSGKDVKPRIIKQYSGETIVLNEELDIKMSPEVYESLNDCIGKDIIVTDGTTLLGADDKAGIVEILDMCQFFLDNPDVKHGKIKVAFTPDEEVGKGADNFNIPYFNAAYAYTVDGDDINSIEYENFNAAGIEVKIQGSSIHPGKAKDKMVNASLIAMEFQSLLPQNLNPALTEGYEGFNHLCEIQGGCEFASMEYIVRNHDREKFEQQKEEFISIKDKLNALYGDIVSIEINDSYYNMGELIQAKMHIVDDVKAIMKDIGMNPISVPIRGGTDGARLSYDGLLCPNIGTGGANYHGKYEYVCIQSMEKISELLVEIVKRNI